MHTQRLKQQAGRSSARRRGKLIRDHERSLFGKIKEKYQAHIRAEAIFSSIRINLNPCGVTVCACGFVCGSARDTGRELVVRLTVSLQRSIFTWLVLIPENEWRVIFCHPAAAHLIRALDYPVPIRQPTVAWRPRFWFMPPTEHNLMHVSHMKLSV